MSILAEGGGMHPHRRGILSCHIASHKTVWFRLILADEMNNFDQYIIDWTVAKTTVADPEVLARGSKLRGHKGGGVFP